MKDDMRQIGKSVNRDERQNVERFVWLLSQVDRPGMDTLLACLKGSGSLDRDPAFLSHCLQVYDCLYMKARKESFWSGKLAGTAADSLVVCSLLHDIGQILTDSPAVTDLCRMLPGERSVCCIEVYMELLPTERAAILRHAMPYDPRCGGLLESDLEHPTISTYQTPPAPRTTSVPETAAGAVQSNFDDRPQPSADPLECYPLALALYEAHMEASLLSS